MNTNIFFNKIKNIENELSRDYGEFSFFAVNLRDDVEDSWDVLINSNKISENNKRKFLISFSHYLNKELENDEIKKMSRVVFLDDKNEYFKIINNSFKGEDIEIRNSFINGISINYLHIFNSK